MAILKGKISSVKVQADLIWFHTATKQGSGWVSLSKPLFDNVYKKVLVKQFYSKSNKEIENKIKRLNREIKLLRKAKNEEAAKQREHEIVDLRHSIKKELHLHDLVGKRIRLRII